MPRPVLRLVLYSYPKPYHLPLLLNIHTHLTLSTLPTGVPPILPLSISLAPLLPKIHR